MDFPKICGTCRQSYSSRADDTTSDARCQRCAGKGHRGCHNDRLADEDIGAVWLCTECIEVIVGKNSSLTTLKTLESNPYFCDSNEIQKYQNVEPPLEDKEMSPVSKYIRQEKTVSDHGVVDNREHQSSKDNQSSQSDVPQTVAKSASASKERCPRLIEGICEYGWSGKGCPYDHPKKCQRYSKFGEDEMRGCRDGDNCLNYHPRICENSIYQKKCFNLSCKQTHLQGTARHCRKREGTSAKVLDSDEVRNSVRANDVQANTGRPTAGSPNGPNDKTNTPPLIGNIQPPFLDPITFLVRRLEGLKANLSLITMEMGLIQCCLEKELAQKEVYKGRVLTKHQRRNQKWRKFSVPGSHTD